MAASERKFDYHFRDWWPIIKKKDLIPVLGLGFLSERRRKERGESLADYYLSWRFPQFRSGPKQAIKELVSLGTANWPEPASETANLRANLMAARNAVFISYHALALEEVLLQGSIHGSKVIRAVTHLLQG